MFLKENDSCECGNTWDLYRKETHRNETTADASRASVLHIHCSACLVLAGCVLETQMSVWVYKRTHAGRERRKGRERSAVSHGCELLLLLPPPLQKISPHLLRFPAPTSCLHYSSVFEANSGDSENQSWPSEDVRSVGAAFDSRHLPPPAVC